MTTQHVIESLHLDVAFRSEAAAFEGQPALDGFLHGPALRVIEEVFDELQPEGGVVAIDRLEIDLGRVPDGGDLEQWERRLRERLRLALHDALQPAMSRVRTPQAARLQTLLHFLSTGRVRWSDGTDVDALAAHVARDNGEALARRLCQTNAEGDALRGRWLRQFGEQRLPPLVRLCLRFEEASSSGSLEDLREAWSSLHEQDPEALAEWMRRCGRSARARRRLAAALRPAQRDRMLALMAPRRRRDIAALMERAVSFVPGHDTPLWASLFEHLLLGRDTDPVPTLHELLFQLAEQQGGLDLLLRDGAHTAEHRALLDALAGEGAGGAVELALLRLRVEAALSSGEFDDGVAHAWRALLRADPAGLRKLLRRQGRRTPLYRLLVQRFSADMRREALGLLVPGEGEAVAGFIAQAVRWQAGRASRAMSSADFEHWLWTLALEPLLSTPGAAPSAGACIAELLRLIGRNEGVAQPVLLDNLRSGLRAATSGNAMQQVLVILDVLAQADAAQAHEPQRSVASAASAPPRRIAFEERIAALCATLDRQAPLSADECEHWREEARHLLDTHGDALRPALRHALEAPQAASRLVAVLPQALLERVLQLLRPGDHAKARQCAELVAQAWAQTETASPLLEEAPGQPQAARPSAAASGPLNLAVPKGSQVERLTWQFLLHELVAEGRRFVAAAFSGRFFNYLAGKLRPGSAASRREAVRHAVARSSPPAGAQGALAKEVSAALASPLPADAPADSPELLDEGEPIYVRNAGLVLAAPYLPRLFGMLGLTDGRAFVDEAATERAAQVLQFMANGAGQACESALVLNKLLCGMPLDAPVAREFTLGEREREATVGLLGAMIQHWSALGRTSVDGLRQTFLCREGRLTRQDDTWRLRVSSGPFDVLLDRLPWGYATVKLPWMPEVLHVEWR